MIRFIIDRLHVSTSDEDVEQEIRRRAKPGSDPKIIDGYVREALEIHHENQKEYAFVMRGGHW